MRDFSFLKNGRQTQTYLFNKTGAAHKIADNVIHHQNPLQCRIRQLAEAA